MQTTIPAFSFAFQPIVNVRLGQIVSFEALVRGINNEPAWKILQQVSNENIHHFDEQLRIHAIPLAAKLGIDCNLNLNLLPRSLELSNTAIASTLEAAQQHNISPSRIIIEVTEGEVIHDHKHFINAIDIYRGLGIQISIDDFGAGYSGLNLLAEFQPDNIKLDIVLVRNVDTSGSRQAIIRGIIRTCTDLGIEVLAEGVETLEEYYWFRDEGVELFQGYLFAKPGFEHLPSAFYPDN
jgi:blue light- and temperature-responsive anti-repressor